MSGILDSSNASIGFAVVSIVAGVCLYLTFRQVVVSEGHPKNAIRLTFAMAAYLVAAFALVGIGSYRAASVSNYALAIKWAQVLSFFSQVALLWFVAHFTRVRPLTLLALLTCGYGVALIMHITSPFGLFLSYIRDISVYRLPWGYGLLLPDVLSNAWCASVGVPNLISMVYVAYACMGQYKRGERRAALLMAGLAAIILATSFHDMYMLGPFFMAPYALLAMVVITGLRPAGLPIARSSADGPESESSILRPIRLAVPRSIMWTQHPIFGTVFAMLLIVATQFMGTGIAEDIIVLLALLGMMQATIGVLYKVGCGKWVRRLAVLALLLMGLQQVLGITGRLELLSDLPVIGSHGFFHGSAREAVQYLGLLLLLNAFYLAGQEAGDARDGLAAEHRRLTAEVAERKKAEHELRGSEMRFRALIEHGTDIIMVLQADRTIRYASASMRLLGYDPEEMLGRRFADYFHPDDLPGVEHEMLMLRRVPGVPRTAEVRVRHRDGSWRFLQMVAQNLLTDPVLKGIVVNARDITEQKLTAERLRQIKVDEQQRIRHDLHDTVGQDLTGLLCMTGSLAARLRNLSLPEAQRADAIIEGVRHTMEDVQAAIHGIAPVDTDPGGLMVALDQLAVRARSEYEMDVRFECQTPVNVSDSVTATHLFRIAQEAVTNAVKHACAQTIVVALAARAGSIVLTVTDDGAGMPASDQSSSGMGLRNMRSRAAAINALLTVEPTIPHGTSIACTVARPPLYEEPADHKWKEA